MAARATRATGANAVGSQGYGLGPRNDDEQFLFALREELQQDEQFKEDDAQVKHTRALRELKQPSGITDDWRITDLEYRDASLAADGFHHAAMLGLQMPTFSVKGKDSFQGQENAEDRERWTEELFYRAGHSGDGIAIAHTFLAMCDAAANDGAGWTKFVYNQDAWDFRDAIRLRDFTDDPGWSPLPERRQPNTRSAARKYQDATDEAKRHAGVPFRWEQVDVLSLYPEFQGRRVVGVLEVTKRPVSRLFRKYKLTRATDGRILLPDEVKAGVPVSDTLGPERTVTFLEYWDDQHVYYAVEGSTFANARGESQITRRLLRKIAHGYGRHPYFAGYGLVMNHWRNRKVGWGTVALQAQLVELRSFLWTLMGNVAARDTFTLLQRISDDPAFATQGNDKRPGQKNKLIESVKWKLREIVQNPPGSRLERVDMGDVAASLEKFIQLTDQALERLSSPRAPANLGSLEASGFAINQTFAWETMRFGPVIQNIEMALEDQARFAWSLVRNVLKEPVSIYLDLKSGSGWKSLGPDDLADTVNVKCTLKTQRAEAELIKARYYHERYEKGSIGWEEMVEELGSSPVEVLKQNARKRLYDSPTFLADLERLVAARAGRGDLIAVAQAAKMAATTGQLPMLPGPLSPMAPGVAPQLAPVGAPGMPGMPGAPGPGGPPAMGSQGVPDMANLAQSPNGVGVRPGGVPLVGPGPTAGEPAINGHVIAAGMPGMGR